MVSTEELIRHQSAVEADMDRSTTELLREAATDAKRPDLSVVQGGAEDELMAIIDESVAAGWTTEPCLGAAGDRPAMGVALAGRALASFR
jgi:hypothetical protein